MFALTLYLSAIVPAAEAAPMPREISLAPHRTRQAVEKSLAFLEKSSATWRTDKKCVTCHQVPFTIWALNEAKDHKVEVPPAKVDDLTRWAFDFCVTNENKGEKTGGFHLTMVDMILSQANSPVREDAIKAYSAFEPLLAMRQKEDGSWREGNQVRLTGGEHEADEVDTMWTVLAIHSLERLGDRLPAKTLKALTAQREKAMGFLKDAKPGKRMDWLALQMLLARETNKADRCRELEKELRSLQNRDGGWGFVRDGASYPHVTGECLFALSVVGLTANDHAVKRAGTYLLGTQQPDGSWKALSRASFSTKPDKINEITIHWGTAWATIGLLRTLPK